MDNQFDQIFDCVTIESTVLHQFESYLQCLSCMNFLWSLRKRSGLKGEFQSYVFDDVRNKLVSAHCTVTSNVTCQFKKYHVTFHNRV